MDTPTICYEPKFYHWDEPRELEIEENVSTAPYLTEYTGATFFEMHELEQILLNIDDYKKKFAPREWVAQNMTDTQVAKLFLEKIGVWD